MSVCLQVK